MSKMGGMRKRYGLAALAPEKAEVKPTPEEEIERRYQDWVKRIGAGRADEARAVLEARPAHQRGPGRASLPNLLAEAWAKRIGFRYEIEVDLGWARPDLVIFTPSGPVVIRVQGDYWHSRPEAVAKDAGQRALLENNTIEGLRILRIVDVWEREIYESEAALQNALEQ